MKSSCWLQRPSMFCRSQEAQKPEAMWKLINWTHGIVLNFLGNLGKFEINVSQLQVCMLKKHCRRHRWFKGNKWLLLRCFTTWDYEGRGRHMSVSQRDSSSWKHYRHVVVIIWHGRRKSRSLAFKCLSISCWHLFFQFTWILEIFITIIMDQESLNRQSRTLSSLLGFPQLTLFKAFHSLLI